MIHKKHIIILILAVCFQVTAQNEDQFLPSELKQLTAVTEPATLTRGFFRLGTAWQYTGFKSVFDENASKLFIPGSSIGRAESFDLSFQYGITDRIQVNLVVPYHMDKVESTQIFDDPDFRFTEMENYSILQKNYAQYGFGFGDISAGLNTQLIEESDLMPAITLRATGILPTGRKNPSNFSADSLVYDSPTGSGEFKLAIDILAKKIVYPYSFTFYTGADFGFGGEKIISPTDPLSQFKSGLIFYAAGGINFHLNDWICMTNDIYFTHIGRGEINGMMQDDTKWRLMILPNVNFQVKKLRLVQGVTIPIIGKMIAADPTYTLIVQYIF